MGTVIVGAVLLFFVIMAVISIIRNKKNGKSSCGGDCSRCSGHCK